MKLTDELQHYMPPGWGRILPYLGIVGKFDGDDPHFFKFLIQLGPYFIPQHHPIDPFFLQKKIGLSLSHLVPEILGPTVGLIFYTKSLYQFTLNFRSN